jgi:hypothetical protein
MTQRFHFVFGLKPQTEPLHIIYFLAMESCRKLNPGAVLLFHYRHEPFGPWWDAIKPHLQLLPVDNEAQIAMQANRYQLSAEGQQISNAGFTYAHEADYIRVQALLRYGGAYVDIDTLCVSPFEPDWFEQPCVMGEERSVLRENGVLSPSLCNAVILGQPNSRFLQTWLRTMPDVFDGRWDTHSCREAARLWRLDPASVLVLPPTAFFYYSWTRKGLSRLFEQNETPPADLYSIHLWAHLWWSEQRTDFSSVHAGLFDERYIKQVDSTYNCLARPFLP